MERKSNGGKLLTKQELTLVSLIISCCILILVVIIQLNMIKLQNLALNRFVLDNCNIQKSYTVTEYKRP